NLGARLEGLTKQYDVTVLVAEDTAARAREAYAFRELDQVRVKGRAGTTRIYELLGPRDQARLGGEALGLFATALEAYRHRDWDTAEEGLTLFLERHPDDGPARVMLGRVRALRASPPGDDWDGVFDQVNK